MTTINFGMRFLDKSFKYANMFRLNPKKKSRNIELFPLMRKISNLNNQNRLML